MMMTEQMEEMIYREGYRRGKAEAEAQKKHGEWKVIKKTINTTLVSCSECGKRFHIPNYCFKSERDRWKCCPICCADMRGEDNE